MKKINRSTGITLIALIITVLIMLILAGTTISVVTSDGSFFSKISSTTKEHKRQSLIEVVKTAETYLKMDKQLGEVEKIDIVILIDKIKWC